VTDLEQRITKLWEGRDDLAAVMPEADARAAVDEAIGLLDTGEARVAELVDGEVVVHEWLKQAILLLFRLAKM
jgi:2,3,4,5-tetrahydropyridine-2-carboxylate N-succinyltransferase